MFRNVGGRVYNKMNADGGEISSIDISNRLSEAFYDLPNEKVDLAMKRSRSSSVQISAAMKQESPGK